MDPHTQVFCCIITEERIIAHSNSLCVLTPVLEALLSLVYPLKWVGTYIPFLPSHIDLDTVADSPCPVLAGTSSLHGANLSQIEGVRTKGCCVQHYAGCEGARYSIHAAG